MTGTESASIFEPALGRRSEELDLHWQRCARVCSFDAWVENRRDEWTDDFYGALIEGSD